MQTPDGPSTRPLLRISFSPESLPSVRRLVAGAAERARLGRQRSQDLVLVVDELASNSVMHGGGGGELALWSNAAGVLCEVRDRGHIADPLAGLRPPRPDRCDGRGLWVVGQLCEDVKISSSPGRTVVRARVRR